MIRLKKPKVVVDTNLLVSALIRRGNPHKVLKAWGLDCFYLLITQDLFEEIERVSRRDWIRNKYGVKQTQIDRFIALIKLDAKFVMPIKIRDVPVHARDVKDDMVLACAIGGKADYLVTGDRDLLELEGNPKLENLKIVSPSDFLKILKI